MIEPLPLPHRRDDVLLEFLGAATRIEDVRERACALAGSGSRVRVVLAGDPPTGTCGEAFVPPSGWDVVAMDRWQAAVRRAMTVRPGAGLVLAGEQAIGRAGAVARFGAHPVRLWPTSLEGDPILDAIALECCVASRPRGITSRNSIWDGNYLLVPGSPAVPAARLLIESFAAIAARHASLDLVFLGEADAAGVSRAERNGVRWRVHWAGASALRAECAWLAGASAVLLTDREAAHPAVALRALAAGAPVLVAGEGARARRVHAWLDLHGACLAPHATESDSLARGLLAALAGGEGALAATRNASALARDHETRAIGAALRARLPEPGDWRAAA